MNKLAIAIPCLISGLLLSAEPAAKGNSVAITFPRGLTGRRDLAGIDETVLWGS